MPEHVRFAGHRNDVAELLPHADVFWIGSEYEGQSNSVIEAMQAGLPVVASDIPGNRDLVIHDQTGRLVQARRHRRFRSPNESLVGESQPNRGGWQRRLGSESRPNSPFNRWCKATSNCTSEHGIGTSARGRQSADSRHAKWVAKASLKDWNAGK